ncbi:MAG: TetR/AcrR family transcriptional regulator [Porticoccaceae bacterium]
MNKRLTQAERTAISDKKLLEAASELINERGTQKATLAEIGKRAGYSSGLASSRFGSKDGLYQYMITVLIQLRKEYTLESLHGETALEEILATLEMVDKMFSRNPVFVTAIFKLWFDAIWRKTISLPMVEKFLGQSRAAVKKIITKGVDQGEFPDDVDPQAFAITYLSFLYGLIYQWMVSPDEVDLSSSLESFKGYCKLMLKADS